MSQHSRASRNAVRVAGALAVVATVLGGDVGRAAASDPPNGMSGVFGQNGNSSQVVPGTGAMTYSVPFQLPAARGSAEPYLGLHYTSGAGTEEAGEGWSLGLPSIERVLR